MLCLIFYVESSFLSNPKHSLEGLLWVGFEIWGYLDATSPT